MSKAAITVEGLGKAYRIGLKEEIPDTLVSAMGSWAKMPLRNFRRLSRLNTFRDNGDSDDTVWALRDVSFEVQEGEVVGVIGRNGAGKSTLLKILSRITEPTAGRAVIHGRVSSLLEVGTGFHPELSGRENVYMNGTILGMTKREIDRKFDEIVEFSGVEKFLDTPIKRYSSGMKVRLAFSVAAHLEPEILIIDEVLAVGDAEFQQKCLGKMHDVAEGGRTVLFVSHNMTAVTSLCTRGLVLCSGRAAYDGRVAEAIEFYSQEFSTCGAAPDHNLHTYRESWCSPCIKWARIVTPAGEYPPAIPLGSGITIELGFDVPDGGYLRSPVMGLVFHHSAKGTIAGVNTRMTGFSVPGGHHREGVLRCTIPKLPFLQGRYTIDVWLGDGPSDVDVLKRYLAFDIDPTDYYQSGKPPFGSMGVVFLDAAWNYGNIYSQPRLDDHALEIV